MKQLVAAIVGPGHAALHAREKTAVGTESDTSIREAEAATLAATPTAPAAPVLTLSNVSNDRLRDVDLVVLKGEVHGLAGLIGSGRTEILQTIFGIRSIDTGIGRNRRSGALRA